MDTTRPIAALLLLTTAPAACIALSPAACGQTDDRRHYDLDAQPLQATLDIVAARTAQDLIVASDDVAGKEAPALSGDYTASEALTRILAGSGLNFRLEHGTILIGSRVKTENAPGEGTPIIVTGTRVRGAVTASPLIRITQDDIRASGYSDLGEIARSLPQSSGGGQNPGVGLGPPLGNENVTGGSTLNLRGLGSDATLTLLNGHRLSYGAHTQSIDISAIPVAAVDTIEVLTDGASAVYGSDAVGGVANIRLKRSYSGVTLSARLAGATSGGGFQQQYGVVTGGKWDSGGILIAGDYEKDRPIFAKDRDYANAMAPLSRLLPGQQRYGFVLAGTQDLGEKLHLEYDGFYDHRTTRLDVILAKNATPSSNANIQLPRNEAGAFSARLTYDVTGSWTASLSSVGAFDDTHYTVKRMRDGAVTQSYTGCYCNDAFGIEANFEGPLFSLGGGAARLALGGGYRYDRMDARREGVYRFTPSRDSSYGYAELFLPFVGAANASPGLSQLVVTAALRYEDYPSLDRIATPKLGLIYSPTPALTLKGSWGKSYKAPTLYRNYFPNDIYLYDATALGCATCAPGTTGMQISGGGDLKAERATSWSATLGYKPPYVEGLELEASYFDIDYRNRVVFPIPTLSQSFDPLYASLVERDPSAARQAEVIAEADGFYNSSSGAYDPAKVVAIVDSRYLNATSQSIWGIDASARYHGQLDARTTVTLSLLGAYLRSRERYSADAPSYALAGTIYDPPRFRLRSGASFARGGASFGTFLNRIGGVRNNAAGASSFLHGMTTLDFSLSYSRPKGTSLLSGYAISLSMQNAFNAKPATFATRSPTYLPYDGTNYSSVGRFLSLSVSKDL